MEREEWRIYPMTVLSDAIRFRPLFLEVLYRNGVDPWKDGLISLETLCSEKSLSADELIRETEGTPVPSASTDWDKFPCYHLIDFLTAEHRLFLDTDLPAVHTLLKRASEEKCDDSAGIIRLQHTFLDFLKRLEAHVGDEENNLFPSILRNEYALGHLPAIPQSSAPLRTFPAAEGILYQEEQFAFFLDYWVELVSQVAAPGCSGTLASLSRLVDELSGNIRAHARLESEKLYPRALALEEKLKSAARIPA